MLYYLFKRLLLAMFTLLAILLVSYCLLRLAPGDPTRSNILGGEEQSLNSEQGTPAVNRAMREKLALDKPWPVGFAQWLWRVVRSGDFGESVAVYPGRPVTKLVAERLPVTLSLNICAVLYR